jgi:hypothetical protein
MTQPLGFPSRGAPSSSADSLPPKVRLNKN